jgi:Phage tail tube protein, GTA-gp10
MTANPHRGEVAVTLAGQQYAARPTYTAVVKWETATNRTSTELLLRFASGNFAAHEVVAVLHAAITAGGAAMPVDQLGELVIAEGLTDQLEPAGKLLRNSLTGGKEPRAGEDGPAVQAEPLTAG